MECRSCYRFPPKKELFGKEMCAILQLQSINKFEMHEEYFMNLNLRVACVGHIHLYFSNHLRVPFLTDT